jgi:hypothetical protein
LGIVSAVRVVIARYTTALPPIRPGPVGPTAMPSPTTTKPVDMPRARCMLHAVCYRCLVCRRRLGGISSREGEEGGDRRTSECECGPLSPWSPRSVSSLTSKRTSCSPSASPEGVILAACEIRRVILAARLPCRPPVVYVGSVSPTHSFCSNFDRFTPEVSFEVSL